MSRLRLVSLVWRMVRKYDSYVSFSASSGEANGLALVLVVGVDLS